MCVGLLSAVLTAPSMQPNYLITLARRFLPSHFRSLSGKIAEHHHLKPFNTMSLSPPSNCRQCTAGPRVYLDSRPPQPSQLKRASRLHELLLQTLVSEYSRMCALRDLRYWNLRALNIHFCSPLWNCPPQSANQSIWSDNGHREGAGRAERSGDRW